MTKKLENESPRFQIVDGGRVELERLSLRQLITFDNEGWEQTMASAYRRE